jgi:Tfx family DNA-binding protein
VRHGLLTERQKAVLRYRREGLTHQQIADIFRTSKSNVSVIEQSAQKNVRLARETVRFISTMDARRLCSIPSGTDLLNVPNLVFRSANASGVRIQLDTLDLIDQLREFLSGNVRTRFVVNDIQVFLCDNGEVFFE